MKFTAEEIKQFETDIEFMENLVRVYEWPSCNEIRAYLAIYGKKRASELAKLVGLDGAKSVYKSLNRLIEAGLVAKDLEVGSQRNASYYSTEGIINDPEFTPPFISYLIEQDRYQLIADYLTAANKASIGFMNVMTQIMERRISQTQDTSIGTRFINQTLFIEGLLSIEDPEPLLRKLEEVVHEVQQHYPTKGSPIEGIDHPAALYLAFVPLSHDD